MTTATIQPDAEPISVTRERLMRYTASAELKSILLITDAALRLHLLKQYHVDHDPAHLPKGP